MNSGLDTQSVMGMHAVEIAYVTSGDPEILKRAAQWPSTPTAVLETISKHAEELTFSEQGQVVWALAEGLSRRPGGDLADMGETIERVLTLLDVVEESGDLPIGAEEKLESVKAALESARTQARVLEAPSPDAPALDDGYSQNRVRAMNIGRGRAPEQMGAPSFVVK